METSKKFILNLKNKIVLRVLSFVPFDNKAVLTLRHLHCTRLFCTKFLVSPPAFVVIHCVHAFLFETKLVSFKRDHVVWYVTTMCLANVC